MLRSQLFVGVCFSLIIGGAQYAVCDETMDEDPQWPGQWQEFRAIVGQPVGSPVVQTFVTRYQLKHHTKGIAGNYSLYGELPFSVLYGNKKVTRVVVDIDRPVDAEDKGPVFEGELPLGLSRDDLPEDVIRKLGKPAHQPERDYLSYDHPNMVISFDRRTHRLNEICLDSED